MIDWIFTFECAIIISIIILRISEIISHIYYIKMKSLQRKQARINTKIRKLNNYYNQPSELWARFFELFFMLYSQTRIFPAALVRRCEVLQVHPFD